MTRSTRNWWPSRAALACLAALLASNVAVGPGALAAQDARASRYYEDALQRYENSDFRGAIVQLKNALKVDSKLLPGHVLLGRALLANGEFSAAEAALDEALKLGVNPVEVVVPLAEAVIGQGRPDQLLVQPRFAHAALPPDKRAQLLLLKAAAASDTGSAREASALLGEARALDSSSAASWIAEVPIRVRARQLKEARVAADNAVKLDPKSAEAAYQQATVAHVSGELKSAVDLYTRTLQLRADHQDALVARSGLYLDLGRIDAATADVAAARKASPTDPRAAYLAALLAARNGNPAEAKKLLTEVTNLLDPVPRDFLRYRPQALMLGGLSHHALGQPEKALPYVETLIRQDPASPASKLLAQIKLSQGQVDQAIGVLEAYLRANPADRQAAVLLASAQMQQGRHARAARLMEDVLRGGDDPSARALLGISLIGVGRFEPAVSELEATMRKDPSQIRAGVALAGLYLASGQADKAVAVATELTKRRPQNPGLHNLLGSAYSARGQVREARSAFERAAQLDPGFVEPVLNLARLDLQSNAADTAQKRIDALLARDRGNVDAMLLAAQVLAMQGRFDEAERWLLRADDASGDRLLPGLQVVEFQLARGQPDRARETMKKLTAKAPDSLLVLFALARTELAAGNAREARSALSRATAIASFDAAALVRIADMQLQADNVSGAAYALDKALTVKPDHLRARALRVTTYMLEGDFANAEKLARSVLVGEPGSGLGHRLLGDLAMARKQPAVAAESYRRALQFDRNSETLLRLFAALEVNQRQSAVAVAQDWLRANPQDALVWRALADSHARAGDYRAARAAYEALLKLSPDDAEALNNLAIVLVGLGDPSAQAVADRAMALKPQTAHIIGTAGWAAFHAGQTDRALQLLRDARLRDPTNASTRYFLAAALARQGRKAEARQEAQAALASGPGFPYAKDATVLLRTLD